MPLPAPARRWALAALAVAAVAYGGLRAASAVSEPERARVADLGALSARDAAVIDGPEAERLMAAVDAVEASRRSVLGLWTTYDAAALDNAGRALAEVAAEAPPASVVSQEARLAHGRILLYRQRGADAARVLGSLVRQGGYRAPQARRLLDWLRAEGDRPGPPRDAGDTSAAQGRASLGRP